MKTFILFISLTIPSICFAITPFRIVNGKIEFAKGKTDDTLFWTQREIDDAEDTFTEFSSTSTKSVELVIPSNFEMSVATSGLTFQNYTDFEKCLKDKSYLTDKLSDIKPSDERKNRLTVDFIKLENSKR